MFDFGFGWARVAVVSGLAVCSVGSQIEEISRKAAKALKKNAACVLYSLRPCDFA